MRSQAFVGITVLMAAAVLILFGITALSPIEPDQRTATNDVINLTPLEKPTVVFGNPYRGPQTARVTIVEFGDFLCGPCATLEETLTRLLEEFPNDLRVVWKDFPNTATHQEALNAAIAARCAGMQGKFWEYHDLLFANQDSINSLAYATFGEQAGLGLQEFQQCIAEQRTRPVVERDFEEGQRLRVDATPYLFINDRRASGALDYDSLRALVASELSVASQPAENANAPVNP